MSQTSELILSVFTFLLLFVILWFTYTVINIIVTILRCRKKDHSLAFCLNSKGKLFYIGITLVYLICLIGGISAIAYGFANNSTAFYRNGVNIIALMSVVYAYLLSSIVLIGKKYMMVGRMQIDYRKLKKVNYTYNNKMSFVYSQQEYSFSTRFVDKSTLRKAISK